MAVVAGVEVTNKEEEKKVNRFENRKSDFPNKVLQVLDVDQSGTGKPISRFHSTLQGSRHDSPKDKKKEKARKKPWKTTKPTYM